MGSGPRVGVEPSAWMDGSDKRNGCGGVPRLNSAKRKPGKTGPASSRLKSKASAQSFTTLMCKFKFKVKIKTPEPELGGCCRSVTEPARRIGLGHPLGRDPGGQNQTT